METLCSLGFKYEIVVSNMKCFKMRNLFLLFFSIVVFPSLIIAQVRSLPSTIDTNSVNPSEIPSPQKLKMMGATDEEVKLITEFKTRKLAEKNNLTPVIDKEQKTEKISPPPVIETEKVDPAALNIPVITPDDPNAIYGQSFFQKNNIKFYDKANQIKAPENYILGVGDNISIAIWGFSDYSEAFTIDQDGSINPKLVGRIYLSGLTFKDAKSLIASKFSRVYDLNNSQIDVTLGFSRVISVNIVGEVNNPGAFTIPAINTAFNALVTVGGIKSIGSVRKIYVKRAGKTIRTLDIYEYLTNPDSKQDFFLENNDYLLIPTSEKVVKISGQVKRSAKYELLETEGLEQLLNYAGGFEIDAYRKSVQIKRIINNQELIMDVNYDSLLIAPKSFALLNGDEILVRKIQTGYVNYVELVGAVKLPGQYEIKKGERVSDLIKRAEGTMFDVFDSRAYVIRTNSDMSKKYIPFELKEALNNPNSMENITLQDLDIVKIFSKTYFKDEFKFSVSGAVRSPGDFTYGEGIALKDALYLAGGLKKEASRTRIEVSRAIDFDATNRNFYPIRAIVKIIEIGKDLRIDENSEQFLIQPYDQIIVRVDPNFDLQNNVVIKGEVMYPGVYTLIKKDEKIIDIINRAGGFTPWAFAQNSKLFRIEDNTGPMVLKLDEAVKDTNSIYNYILRNGDTLTIPKIDELIQLSGYINYTKEDSINKVSVPFIEGKTAKYYVNNYGLGFKKGANKKGTYVMLSGGSINRTKKLLFIKFYPRVPRGSSIIVPQKDNHKNKDRKKSDPIDWNTAIEKGTVKITALVTLYLLFSRLTPIK